MQRLAVVIRLDLRLDGAEHRSRIEPRVHLHDGHTGDGVARGDGPLDRGRAPMPREERRVDVEASEPWNIQQRLGKDLAVGGDHDEVGCDLPKLF